MKFNLTFRCNFSFYSQLLFVILSLLPQGLRAEQYHSNYDEHWMITNLQSGFSYSTDTQKMKVRGVEKRGLISFANRGGNTLYIIWQKGAYRATVYYNNETLVDGYSLNDVSRISSFRFDKNGDFVYIKTTKGPKAKVKLFYNDKAVLQWPRLTKIKVLSLTNKAIILSHYDESMLTTTFLSYQLNGFGLSQESKRVLGTINQCDVLSAKVVSQGIFIQTYCDNRQGSDIQFLNFVDSKLHTVFISNVDEFFAPKLLKVPGAVKRAKHLVTMPVLSVSGSSESRQLFHAISGSFLSLLGEPMSVSSDEAGKQSWSQSYRTLTLAELFDKTKHPAFAKLAIIAMRSTLAQQNSSLDINQDHNPDCGWASRIYSVDGTTPISFMINQAMIINSLINSCNKIDLYCDARLRKSIDSTATCLVSAYERYYVENEGLYRIPYGSNFRYDGLYAPWNWQVTWASVLEYVSKISATPEYSLRAHHITQAFIDTWQLTDEENARVIWKYWTPHYYDGWHKKDNVSVHRPYQKPIGKNKLRYEDLNHAGISLLGLHFLNYQLTAPQQTALINTASHLLESNTILPRDMDGKGPKNPRWSLGAGWHAYVTKQLKNVYAVKLPGSVSSNKHLAYAKLGNIENGFDLTFSLSLCVLDSSKLEQSFTCAPNKKQSWRNINDFLNNNPLFKITNLGLKASL